MAKQVSAKWRQSASLIILAKDKAISDCDYKVLLFNRAQKSTFFPNAAVFPGGVHESSDASSKWLDHINSFGQSRMSNILQCKAQRPSIFTKNVGENIGRDISMRITAIRETFEETGILLSRQRYKDLNQINNGYCRNYEGFDRVLWQQIVHNNHTQFLTLCKELNVVPDVCSLFEWTAWLTPTTFQKRFETAFYLVALEHIPNVILESNEAASAMWMTPLEFLKGYFNKELILPPPQFYELSRLLNFKRLDDLLEFAHARSKKGVTLMLPVIQNCTDGSVSLMPGDDQYPKNPLDSDQSEAINLPISEYRLKTKNLHRIEFFNNSKEVIQLNCLLADGHLPPVNI